MNGHEIKDPQHIESQASVRKPKSILFRVCCPVFIIVPSLVDIIWQCYVQYVQLYPLSPSARIIRATSQSWSMFVVSENFFMVLIVAYNTFLLWSTWERRLPFSINRPPARDPGRLGLKKLFAYTRYLVFLILFVVVITIPFWWRSFAWSIWRRTLWRNAHCQGWDFLVTMDTVDYRQFSSDDTVALSKASIWGIDGSNYTMELEHPASSRSIISVRGDDWSSTPYIVDYNLAELRYSSPTLSGTFTDFPVPSFPDLSLYSRFPNYTWNWECDAPGVVLTDGNQEVVRTTVGNYDDCTMLNVCGMGSFDRLVVPLGVILIEMEKSGLCCTSPFVYVLPRRS